MNIVLLRMAEAFAAEPVWAKGDRMDGGRLLHAEDGRDICEAEGVPRPRPQCNNTE